MRPSSHLKEVAVTLLFTASLLVAIVLAGWAIYVVTNARYMTNATRSWQIQAIYAIAVVVTYVVASVFPL